MQKHPFPRRWLRLHTRELDALLRRLRLPFDLSESLRDAVKAEKTLIRSAKAKRRVRQQRWGELLRQVKYEAHKVDLRQRHFQKTGAACPARAEAFSFYAAILSECLRRMKEQCDNLDAPLPQTQDYRDFIPDKIKAQVHLRFDAIPRGDGKRVAEPFGEPLRPMPPSGKTETGHGDPFPTEEGELR